MLTNLHNLVRMNVLKKKKNCLFFSDLSSHGDIQNVILESFSSQNEEVKSAASYALGKILISLIQLRCFWSFWYICRHNYVWHKMGQKVWMFLMFVQFQCSFFVQNAHLYQSIEKCICFIYWMVVKRGPNSEISSYIFYFTTNLMCFISFN